MAAKKGKDQRIERLPLGTPFDLYASPKPTITPLQRQREAQKQWALLNTAQKTVVGYVLRNGRVPLTEFVSCIHNQRTALGIDRVRSVTDATNFLQVGGSKGGGY